MTCYETLRASAPAADAPMAHHFVKWWRNKFRNGYKKFSIGTESERTDTEELVSRAASQCSAPPDLLPSEARALLQPASPPPIPARAQEHARIPPSSRTTDLQDDKQPRLRFEILTALNFYARGSYQGSVGQNMDGPMAQQTVSRCLQEVTTALNAPHILRKHIRFPQNRNERNLIKRKFYDKYGLPGVVGCIDCSHVAIVRPSEHEEQYFNRKHFHSINTQVELTCDVELKHPEPSKQQPLQFSFTLYDLDGHGRMTKDDIAGIVSTIYESIGKSVTVPHYGSKTIQVRLTVVPEDGRTRSERDRREGRRRRRREQNQNTAPPECADNSDDEHERLSFDDDASSKSSCSGDRRPQQRPAASRPRTHRHPRKEHREHRHIKKRSGSLQRRELLEIIQANMEKNHMNFQTSRKPSDPVANDEEITNKYQKHRNRSQTVSEKPVYAFQKLKSENSGNGYLDLASGGDSNLCRYDRYLHAVICSSARHAHTGYHQKQTQPTRTRAHAVNKRSRSHDLPGQTQPLQQPRVLQIIFL